MELNKHDNELTLTSDYSSPIVDLEKQYSFTLSEKRQQSYNNQNLDKDIDNPTSLEKVYSTLDEASIIEPLPKHIQDDIPDGGYGWAVAIAGFCANFFIFGIRKASTLELMAVGSVMNVTLNLFTPVSIMLAKFGTKFNYALGSILMCLGLMLASFTTEVWHLYLTQGVLFGFGCSFLYMSVSSVIPQCNIGFICIYLRFTTRRATAMGISSCGSGLGGLGLSPMVRTILVKDRLPNAYIRNQPIKSPIQLSLFKKTDFNIWLMGSVIALMGYLGPMFYLPKYAADINLTPQDSSNLLAIVCAMNAVGRIVFGFLADKIGQLNMFITVSALAGIFSFVIWPFATSYNVLLVFCILWGITSGMYYTLAAPITANVIGMNMLSSGLSMVFIFSAISAMGTPIMAALQESHGYLSIQMFDGTVYVTGALICLFLKYRLTRGSLLSKC
ncbi:hypothetical protein INT45_010171 [Circinella minor]|uniref:Major facilitator superfamily (MFS) profile domain-containing protein n=1 Tax=Circinella minor TaxID=1195481 RepID=A0A8H7SCP8_9FUNG|nr:hypothetical protein INT45_010171 [Circinella minor]